MNGRLLLDTHVFLWWMMDSPRLSADARHRIGTADIVFVSAATAWEAGIKAALGKLQLPEPIERGVEQSAFARLPITFSRAEAAAALPAHHRDPFDRMLVAQAQVEGLTLVTNDDQLRPYDVRLLWT